VSDLFLAFEGIDGCGKSTQAKRIASLAGARYTFEPGDTPLGQTLRQRLLDATEEMTPHTEALLMLADRSHHVATVITPTLAAGERIVSDRFLGSTLAYQGYGRGVDVTALERATDLAVGACRPGLTIVVDIPVEVAYERRAPDRRDRFESAGRDFHERVREGFLDLARRYESWIVIDGSQDLETVSREVDDAVKSLGWLS
jgi:dTMP kinase